MKISYNWLKNYIDIDLSPEELSEILTGIGLEVSGVEKWESIQGGLEGVVIGHVIECGKHPNADRLSLTRVDIGVENLQIVCGADNVAEGQKVLVATIGTTLYPLGSDPLKIKKGKIRGEYSEGMICSEDEVGMGTDHSGIVVLPDDAPLGKPASSYIEIEYDWVIDIDLTPNRSDATSHLGVARDLAAFLKINRDHSGVVDTPSPDKIKLKSNRQVSVKVSIENEEACPRYSGISITGVEVKASPGWMQNRLRSIGVRPINNIVDITNFVLHEYGQPLHAFDIDKIGKQEIVVKTLPAGTEFTTLDEVSRKLDEGDLMICDGDGKGMCIAGVFGGIGSGITENTTKLFIESAHFDAKWVRKTSMRHLLRTDAATHFEKGVDPNKTVEALKRAAELILEIAGGELASGIVDVYPRPVKPARINLRPSRVSHIFGVDVPGAKIAGILEALQMTIRGSDQEVWQVDVPTDKADVVREIDVIEEILRIYDYNEVPMPNRMKISLTNTEDLDPHHLRQQVGVLLNGMGLHEAMSMSLTQSRYLDRHADLLKSAVPVLNTSNIHLDILRPTLLLSGLEVIQRNQNRQNLDLKFYEFGHNYLREGQNYREEEILAIFLTGMRTPPNWITASEREVDFYTLKGYTEAVLERMNVRDTVEKDITDSGYWHFGREIYSEEILLATYGQVDPDWVTEFDLRHPVFYTEFRWHELLKITRAAGTTVEEIGRFPAVKRDLAVIVDKALTFEQIRDLVGQHGDGLIREIVLFDVYDKAEVLGENKKSYAFRLTFENPDRTLKDKDVDKIMRAIIRDLDKQLGAKLR